MTAALSAAPAAQGGRSCLPYLLAALAIHAGVLALPLDWKPVWQEALQSSSAFSARLSPRAAEAALVAQPSPAALPVPPQRPLPARSRIATPVATPEAPGPLQPAPAAGEAAVPTSVAIPESAPPGRPAGVPSSPARFDAAYLNNPHPAYPAASRRLGEEGRVLLRVRVGADGRPVAVDIERGSHFARLDEAARDAVTRWRFVPAQRGDETVEGSVLVPLVFRLDQ